MAKAARVLFYCLVIWAPLPFGSNRPIFWLINGIVASAIIVLFVAGEVAAERRITIDLAPVAWPLAAMTVWAVWMVIQTLPGLPQFLQHPLWSTLVGDLPGASGTISIAPASTWTTIAQVTPIVFLAPVAIRLGFDRSRGLILLRLIAATSVAVAAYGLLAQYLGFQQVFLLASGPDNDVLTGTFVGHNAAATYFSIGLAAAFSLLVANVEVGFGATPGPERTLLDAADATRHAGIWFLACLILAAALLGTGSRAGVTAGLIAILLVALFWGWRASVSRRALTAVVVAAVVAAAVVVFVSGDALFRRLETGAGNGDRLLAYQDTIDMILARPLLGHGAGTFTDAFPLFHARASSAAIWNAAHNSYLQAAAELGLPVFAVVILAIGGVLAFLIGRLVRRSQPAPVAIAATAALAAVGLHSALDFSVQFQAIGLTLIGLVSAGLGEAMVLVGTAKRSPQSAPTVQSLVAAAPGITETIYVTLPTAGRAAERSVSSSRTAFGGSGHQSPVAGVDQRLYVFGDSHGRLDLVLRLKAAIEEDRERFPTHHSMVIGLGDYIDRGPDSKAVIEALVTGFGCPSIMLRGNHEQMLLDFLEDPERWGAMWLEYGAAATLGSYGVKPMPASRHIDFRDVRDRLADAIPPAHVVFIERMKTSHQTGDYFFAHAGARPGTSLDQQKPGDLLWIRRGFADRDAAFEKVVIHGHTPVEKPYLGQFRINLDTAAYMSGELSCLVIGGDDRRLLEI